MNKILSIHFSKEPHFIGGDKMEENIKVEKEPRNKSKRD
jgi:hypothetical protein